MRSLVKIKETANGSSTHEGDPSIHCFWIFLRIKRRCTSENKNNKENEARGRRVYNGGLLL